MIICFILITKTTYGMDNIRKTYKLINLQGLEGLAVVIMFNELSVLFIASSSFKTRVAYHTHPGRLASFLAVGRCRMPWIID